MLSLVTVRAVAQVGRYQVYFHTCERPSVRESCCDSLRPPTPDRTNQQHDSSYHRLGVATWTCAAVPCCDESRSVMRALASHRDPRCTRASGVQPSVSKAGTTTERRYR